MEPKGIRLFSNKNTTVTNNIVYDNGSSNGFYGIESDSETMELNYIYNNTNIPSNGMYLRTSSKGIISNNHIITINAASKGIWIYDGGTDLVINSNYIEGYTTGIIEQSGTPDYNIITSNNLRNCANGVTSLGVNNVIVNNIEP